MSKILVVGENEDLKQRLESDVSGKRFTLTVSRRNWRNLKRRPPTRSEADVLVLDLTAPDAYKSRGLGRICQQHARLLFVLPTDAATRIGNLSSLLEQPGVDFVRPAADSDEIRQRIIRLLHRPQAQPASLVPITPEVARTHLLPELHQSASGRLDARRIAEFFGIPLADVARSLDVSLSRLHKTPAAPSAQTGLSVYERIAYALLLLTGTKENARIWLNLPEAQLSGKTPMSLLREGRGHIAAQMLDDMLIGQPS